MKQVVRYYNRLNLLAFAVFLVLVFLQSIWLWNAALLQQKESELQLKKLVSDVALEVNSLGHNYFHNEDSLLPEKVAVDSIETKINAVLIENGIEIPVYFSIFKESDTALFITNQATNKIELLESEIKA